MLIDHRIPFFNGDGFAICHIARHQLIEIAARVEFSLLIRCSIHLTLALNRSIILAVGARPVIAASMIPALAPTIRLALLFPIFDCFF